ncbi:MAG TPA: xanthine dehydrogenase family protein subunit M [Vicinamibacterales bacterium]|nr:xanthine dehydrogenase family protein subunit M [Vicinamibacterales bacterium]
MFAPSFDYYRAKSVAEAGDLLRKNPGAKLLAGGHSLIPLLKLRLAAPAALIDIGRIAELKGVTVEDGAIRIGALTTHAELAASAAIRDNCPVLAEAAQLIGDPAVRNRGTIGGNVAHADPASDLPTVLTALGARFIISSGGQTKTSDPATFFTGIMATTLGEHDLLVAVEVPARQRGQGQAYVKFSHPASRYAVIGVAAVVTASGGTCRAASVALGGLTPNAVRASAVERALVGQTLTAETIARAAAQASADLGGEVLGDVFASAAYRKAVAPVWVKRALAAAADRAK